MTKCGKQFSDKASNCPHCGAVNEKLSTTLTVEWDGAGFAKGGVMAYFSKIKLKVGNSHKLIFAYNKSFKETLDIEDGVTTISSRFSTFYDRFSFDVAKGRHYRLKISSNKGKGVNFQIIDDEEYVIVNKDSSLLVTYGVIIVFVIISLFVESLLGVL